MKSADIDRVGPAMWQIWRGTNVAETPQGCDSDQLSEYCSEHMTASRRVARGRVAGAARVPPRTPVGLPGSDPKTCSCPDPLSHPYGMK